MTSPATSYAIPTELSRLNCGLHLLGIALCGAIVSGSYFGLQALIGPRDAEVTQQVQQAQSLFDQQQRIRANHIAAKRRLSERQGHLEQLLSRIPASPQEADFLAQLTELTQKLGISVQEYHPGTATAVGEYSMLEVDVTAIATYAGICGFLQGVPNLPRLCQITELEVQTAGPTVSSLPVKMKLRIFFVPEGRDGAAEVGQHHA